MATTRPTESVVPFEVSPNLPRQASIRPYQREPGTPTFRPLRIYTLDPSVSYRLGGVATVQVPYERLEKGPAGSLFRLDPTGVPAPLRSELLDLDDPFLLMSNGLTPSPADGRFHLQMAYAVCSLTYTAFRRALGRDIAWAIPPVEGQPLRLVVRPFGFKGRNAGYSRETGDLSFGYFPAGTRPAGFTVRKGLICTALSHDIIAHETTHALLDGLRSQFMLPTNVDVPAFHEALGDLVALFLHFTYEEVVEQAIRTAGGVFTRSGLLADLAREFGYARARGGRGAALRSAVDVDGVAAFDSDVAADRDRRPVCYEDAGDEPHALGSVLVSAVFEAFTTIVSRKTERYFQMAGINPRAAGTAPLGEALVKALAKEAKDVATQFLDICIRAVDYCPPSDMELGEFLRALITADGDVEQSDRWGYREALMRSFRRRNLFPDHVRFMTEDAVRWQPPQTPLVIPGLAFSELRFAGDPGRPADADELMRQARALGTFVSSPAHARHFQIVAPSGRLPARVTQASPPTVQSVRVSRRAQPNGDVLFDLVAEVTQSCTVTRGNDLFDVNGGCTVMIDPYGQVRYIIHKRLDSENRQNRQHAAMRGPLAPYWRRAGRKFVLRPGMLKRLHGHG